MEMGRCVASASGHADKAEEPAGFHTDAGLDSVGHGGQV
jgi:hypothetical protein